MNSRPELAAGFKNASIFWRAAVLVALFAARGPGARADESAKPLVPRLAIVLVFDQMRGDYLSRWQDLFGEGGFGRLQTEGAWFTHCHYPYANTVTAAGHASLSTGSFPSEHGVVDNDWYDLVAGEKRHAVENGNYRRVPSLGSAAPTAGDPSKKEITGISPQSLLAQTLGDALLEASGNRSRIVSVALKDRSAVMLGSHRKGEHNSCYWFDADTGMFVTSSYYRNQLEDWVAQFNTSFEGHSPADRWFGKKWDRLRSDVDYERFSGPDDAPGEGSGFRQGRTFPHPFGTSAQPGKAYYDALLASPFGNELLLEFAKRAIDEEGLGTRDVPDLLCVGFSCNDLVGHQWGPDSQEVLDVTLRSDRIVAELLKYLDERPQLKGRYVVAISADHGVCPLPETVRAGKHPYDAASSGADPGMVALLSAAAPAGAEPKRVAPKTLRHWARDILKSRYGEDLLLEHSDMWLYLDRSLLARRGLRAADVEEVLAQGLKGRPEVLAVYTRMQLNAGLPPTDLVGASVRRSYFPARSGDVAVILRPYLPLSGFPDGTTHGTPHPYDTHVPLLVYGANILKGVHEERVVPQLMPVILARALGIEPPTGAKTPLPKGLFASP